MDIEEIAALLAIVDATAGHSGKLNGISNAAMDRLLEINQELRDAAMKRNKKLAEEEAEKQQVKESTDDNPQIQIEPVQPEPTDQPQIERRI